MHFALLGRLSRCRCARHTGHGGGQEGGAEVSGAAALLRGCFALRRCLHAAGRRAEECGRCLGCLGFCRSNLTDVQALAEHTVAAEMKWSTHAGDECAQKGAAGKARGGRGWAGARRQKRASYLHSRPSRAGGESPALAVAKENDGSAAHTGHPPTLVLLLLVFISLFSSFWILVITDVYRLSNSSSHTHSSQLPDPSSLPLLFLLDSAEAAGPPTHPDLKAHTLLLILSPKYTLKPDYLSDTPPHALPPASKHYPLPTTHTK